MAYLGVQLEVWHAKPDEAGEEGLIQVAVLLEGHVLHDRRQLMVIANEDDPFQTRQPILLLLQDDPSILTIMYRSTGNHSSGAKCSPMMSGFHIHTIG